jgi:uncharacterized protein (UPF0333 family)
MVSKAVRVTCLGGLAIALLFVLASTGCGNNDNDTTPPVITDVKVTDISETSATIIWTTDEPATSYVECGQATDAGTITGTSGNKRQVTVHRIKLEELGPAATYNYQVRSKDKHGNEATSEWFTFTTSS